MADSIDLVFSFDCTGSMASCIGQVRKSVEQTIKYLFDNIPDIRIGIMAHGDYCDGSRILTILDLSNDRAKICKFVREVPNTGGGDAPEAYEFVLNRARTLSWKSSNNRALVMIGDEVPHKKGSLTAGTKVDLDWKNELSLLNKSGIKVYPIQCLTNSHADYFYDTLASESDVEKLELDQFSDINDFILALCFARAGRIGFFEETLESREDVSYSVLRAVDSLSGRKVRSRPKSVHSLSAVRPGRFQILNVPDDVKIKDFVEDNGLVFKEGRGFYEFTKPVLIQDYKEVVIQDRKTGEMFTGDKARELLGIPIGRTEKVRPTALGEYRGFIQSTSNNRKLLGGTKFLYDAKE